MAQVTVTISGKTYRMACDDGQEEHLRGLARALDASIEEMRGGFGEIGDQRLTVMSAIATIDQLGEARRRIARLEAEIDALKSHDEIADGVRGERERALAERVSAAATRVTALADALSRASTRESS